MKKKVLLGLTGAVLVFIVVFAIYKIATFSLFDVEIKEVKMVVVPEKGFKIGVFYLPANATSQNHIQVRKIENGIENVIGNFERYDFVVNTELIGDSLFLLVLKDTSNRTSRLDTVWVNLN